MSLNANSFDQYFECIQFTYASVQLPLVNDVTCRHIENALFVCKL